MHSWQTTVDDNVRQNLTRAPWYSAGGWWSGVNTMTSSPAARSPLMRHSNRFFMPLTWLKGLGSCGIAE